MYRRFPVRIVTLNECSAKIFSKSSTLNRSFCQFKEMLDWHLGTTFHIIKVWQCDRKISFLRNTLHSTCQGFPFAVFLAQFLAIQIYVISLKLYSSTNIQFDEKKWVFLCGYLIYLTSSSCKFLARYRHHYILSYIVWNEISRTWFDLSPKC